MLELIALVFEDDDSSATVTSLDRLTPLVSDEVRALASSGDSIKRGQAVRIFRNQTGASLREALYVVDRIPRSSTSAH